MANNILDEGFALEGKEQFPPKNKVVSVLIQVFFGAGFFYVDKNRSVKWLYLLVFIYGFVSCTNMVFWENVRIGLESLVNFHNKNGVGALSLFGAFLIHYIAVPIHLIITLSKRDKSSDKGD